MTASPQRIAANRENAKKSTGPRSDAGKERSRFNGLTHGMRAEAILLPGEDPEALDARREAWISELQPEGDVELGYLEAALIASWRVDRCLRHETATLTKQILDAQDDLDETEQLEAVQASYHLWDDPAVACTKLRRTAAGCALMIERWRFLKEVLANRKYWDYSDRGQALNLIGKSFDDVFRDSDVNKVMSASMTLICNQGTPPEQLLPHLKEPVGMLRSEYLRRVVGLAANMGKPEQGTAFLNKFIDERIEELVARMNRLQDRAARDRAARADCLCFDESKTGAARQRYEMAHRRVMRQALDDLRKAQAIRRSTDAPSEAKPVAPTEAKPEPEPVAPSEAKPDPADPAPSEPNSAAPEANFAVPTVREGLFSRVFTRSAATS
jgi:hypothetical protein